MNWILEVLVFVPGGNPENPEKNILLKGENKKQTQSIYHHCTIPAPNILFSAQKCILLSVTQ